MEITEENLMISDKVWILVAMLLRHGKSCTPSQLSNRCHVLKFTSSEITWLCKLPFSPLCLSQRGEVTFSHLALHLFEGAKAKYEEPSVAFVSWTNPLSDPVNLSTAVPLVHLPAQYSSLPCKSDFDIYLRKDEDPSSESQPISTDTLCREPTRKRRKEVTFLSPNKKLNSTIVNSHVKVNDIGSEVTYSSMLSSLSGIKGKASCTLNVSMDAKKIHGAHTDLVIQRQAVALTECTSCYSQQSCTAITHCPNDSAVIGLNDLASNRQNFVHLFDKAEGKEFCAAIKCKSCFESFVRLENFMHMQSAQTCPATEIDDRVTLLTHQEHSQEPGGESGTVAERNQAKESSAAGILHNATIESSKTVLKDDAGVIGVSSHDISKKEVAACCSCKHDKIKIENGTFGGDGAEHPVPNVIKYTGKSVKQSRQKLINVKQASKLSKIRKTSSTRKQGAPAGSAVMEVCSSQPVEGNFPAFERFIVEAVEGSGGYGTVYKAVSKIDGKLFAIKYPFERTSGKHVQNEIKVLQKYGGQNFIPRCLEVIEESGRQCLVLEYIEHEKPEVLKKEISISELQCYGFSLFKALEYLHSKGVIHRDVKPGNFLFSRKSQCGWLVDFNLAMLQMKQSPSGSKVRKLAREGISGKCEFERRINHGTKATLDKTHREVSVREQGSMSTAFSSRANMKYVEMGQEIVTPPCCTPTQDAKLHKEGTNPVSAQMWKCAEGAAKRHRKKLQTSPESAFDHTLSKFSPAKSPVTKLHLMKDTSPVSRVSRLNTSTHWSPLKEQERHLQSGERQNGDQVLPRYGRRELWELVQKTQQSPQPTVAALPSPHKKRVAAPQKRKSHKDQSFPHASTMPVSKSFVKAPIGGHLPKVRGMQKVRREGPCAGTKGYRAPEVLLKSLLQSEKIDVWSAGVSLCQLVLGKSPFLVSSSIEQSLIDIAQFCGVDAISNLAKEHNREASLPKELSPSAMQPTSVHQWCDKNTKRPELLPLVPDSLFDLLGRCLQIDPKNRISAKEALQHEFFESCRKPAS